MAQCSDEAKQFLESLLCLDFSQDSGERTFTARGGYRTVFTDIFSDVNSVTVNGQAVDYYPAFFDKRNGSFFNSIVLDRAVCGEVVIDADWGFDKLPADLKILSNAIIAYIPRQAALNREINSKKVEDVTISYNHSSITMSDTLWESLVKDYANTIDKYSMCDIGYIKHGETCHHGRFCAVC